MGFKKISWNGSVGAMYAAWLVVQSADLTGSHSTVRKITSQWHRFQIPTPHCPGSPTDFCLREDCLMHSPRMLTFPNKIYNFYIFERYAKNLRAELQFSKNTRAKTRPSGKMCSGQMDARWNCLATLNSRNVWYRLKRIRRSTINLLTNDDIWFFPAAAGVYERHILCEWLAAHFLYCVFVCKGI